jgi:ATP-binding cassette subfamily C protein CydC
VGEAGISFSLGQARRLALARTLLTNSEIVVLDEPVSGLDQDSAAHFWSALKAAGDLRTLIVITHGEVPPWFDRTLELRAGALTLPV